MKQSRKSKKCREGEQNSRKYRKPERKILKCREIERKIQKMSRRRAENPGTSRRRAENPRSITTESENPGTSRSRAENPRSIAKENENPKRGEAGQNMQEISRRRGKNLGIVEKESGNAGSISKQRAKSMECREIEQKILKNWEAERKIQELSLRKAENPGVLEKIKS